MKKNLILVIFIQLGVTLLCLIGAYQAMAQNADSINKSTKVNKLFECTNNNAFPGASVIVIHHGKILLNKGYGFENIEQSKINTPMTVFRLGSITKQFTAMAILQMSDKNMLKINDSIEEYFPGTLNGNKITIKHLLTHTSGITESLNTELAFIPGSQISYSNAGYKLLGKIIEKVSGMSYEKYLQENIFRPLGMENTGSEHSDIKVKNTATGYKISRNGIYINAGEDDVSRTFAAGAIYSTTEDMFKWDQALYTEKLVKESTLNQAFSQSILNDGSTTKYGFGWMVSQWRGLKEVGHGGDVTGFNSFIARYPDEQFTVIVLSNIEMRPPGPLKNAEDLAHNIAGIYLSDKISPTKEHIAIQLDSKILENYIGKYKLINPPQSWIETSGDIYTVILKDNQLFVQSKLGETEIYPETEILFFIKDNSTISFTKENNRVTGMVIDAMGFGLIIVNGQKLN